MSSYKFNEAQRWAVYSTYGQICYMCRRPIDLKNMEVDHVLPEHLLKVPTVLSHTLKQYGLPESHNLNDYGNWLPACYSCNSKKRGNLFDPTPIIQAEIEYARSKADKARIAESGVASDRSLARAISIVIRAEQGLKIESEHIDRLINHLFEHDDDIREKALKSLKSKRQSGNTMAFAITPLQIYFTPFCFVVFEGGHRKIIQSR